MSKIKFSALLGAAAILLGALMTGPSMAGFGIGIQGSAIYVETSGTETSKTDGSTTSASESAAGAVPGGFIQYTFGDDGFVIGVEKMPGQTSMGRGTRSGTDHLAGNDPSAATITQTVAAEIKDHYGIYVETPGFGPAGFFAKLGYSQFLIETNETLETGAAYDNETANGTTFGIGFKGVADSGMIMKAAYEYTDYDSVTFKSVGSDAVSTVVAEPETYVLKLSLGYQF